MQQVTIRLFASHPVAARQYARVLCSDSRLRLVADDEPAQVGVFDSLDPAARAMLAGTRARWPRLRALVLADCHNEHDYLRWALEGAVGVVAFSRCEEELAAAANQVAEGRVWFPAFVVIPWMIHQAAGALGRNRSLTARETEVVRLLVSELTNKEIGQALRINERTVKFHVTSVLAKMGLASRKQIITAWRSGTA